MKRNGLPHSLCDFHRQRQNVYQRKSDRKHAARQRLISQYTQGVLQIKDCSYKSEKCKKMKAVKRNGLPHSLCDFHRQRQSAHERKSDRKHRDVVCAAKQRLLQIKDCYTIHEPQAAPAPAPEPAAVHTIRAPTPPAVHHRCPLLQLPPLRVVVRADLLSPSVGSDPQ